MILKALNELELEPLFNKQGVIHFYFLNKKFRILFDKMDANLIIIVIPTFFVASNSTEKIASYINAHKVTTKHQFIKIVSDGLRVSGMYEYHITDTEYLEADLQDAFFSLLEASEEFMTRMEIYLEAKNEELLSNIQIHLN